MNRSCNNCKNGQWLDGVSKLTEDCAQCRFVYEGSTARPSNWKERCEETIEQVKGERDAAFEALKISGGCGNCVYCKTDYDEEPCDSCRQDSRFPNWKWRGPDGQA